MYVNVCFSSSSFFFFCFFFFFFQVERQKQNKTNTKKDNKQMKSLIFWLSFIALIGACLSQNITCSNNGPCTYTGDGVGIVTFLVFTVSFQEFNIETCLANYAVQYEMNPCFKNTSFTTPIVQFLFGNDFKTTNPHDFRTRLSSSHQGVLLKPYNP